MKFENKRKKYMKVTLKNILIFLMFIIVSLYMMIFYNIYFRKDITQETIAHAEELKISNAKIVDIEDILEQNVEEGKKEEYITREEVLEYITKYVESEKLPKGKIQVIQEGREGKQEITTKSTYMEEELVEEKQMSSKMTKAAINKIVEIGTGNYKDNYKSKVGDDVYVTSDRLSVMIEPNEESQKIATLQKGNKLKILEISENWYKISGMSVAGYVKSECTTHINPNESYVQNDSGNVESSKSKTELTNGLNINMSLNKPSGLTQEQFVKILTDNRDTKKIFQNNAQYFYYIEKQYNINGVFVASVGIHESAWGTSKIAQDKNNLFGYGAYDSNPYNGAYSFTQYSECIDLIARVFVKYYINPKGTAIYGGEKAVATYYNGPTLNGINTKYATDKNWANGVYNHMKYLYNKL